MSLHRLPLLRCVLFTCALLPLVPDCQWQYGGKLTRSWATSVISSGETMFSSPPRREKHARWRNKLILDSQIHWQLILSSIFGAYINERWKTSRVLPLVYSPTVGSVITSRSSSTSSTGSRPHGESTWNSYTWPTWHPPQKTRNHTSLGAGLAFLHLLPPSGSHSLTPPETFIYSPHKKKKRKITQDFSFQPLMTHFSSSLSLLI